LQINKPKKETPKIRDFFFAEQTAIEIISSY